MRKRPKLLPAMRLRLFSLMLALGFLALTAARARAEAAAGPVSEVQSQSAGGVRVAAETLLVPSSSPGLPMEITDTAPAAGAEGTDENEWVVAPVPFISPLLGAGIAGGVGYIYHPPGTDKKLPPWTTLLGGFYSENKSWGVALAHKMNLRGDGLRLTGVAGYGYVKYDFYGVGSAAGNTGPVSLAQTAYGGSVEGLFRVRAHFYAGLSYALSRVETRVPGSNLPPWMGEIVSRGELNANLSIPTLRMEWDSRDNSFYPTRGWLVDCDVVLSDERVGSDYTYQAVVLSAKRYWRLTDRQTVAVYGFGRFAFGDVPFFALSMIGAKGNLRGYSVGRYQDRMALTGQVEYRWQAWRRFGVVAFAGLGAVAPNWSGFSDAAKLPGAGVGVRYLLTEANRLNFRLDVAWGKGERLIYVGVGEAF